MRSFELLSTDSIVGAGSLKTIVDQSEEAVTTGTITVVGGVVYLSAGTFAVRDVEAAVLQSRTAPKNSEPTG